MTEEIMKVKFDPEKTDQADIFADELACTFWSQYRRWHIISQNGLTELNYAARSLINKGKLPTDEAKEFLEKFIMSIDTIEMARGNASDDWIEKSIPYLTGEKVIKLVRVNE